MKNKFILLLFVISLGFLPKLVSAATIFVSPGSGNYSVGSQFNVTVRTNTQGQAANTVEASLTYSTDTLEVVRVSQGSTFYLAAPGSPGKGLGTIYLGGGLPTPGYSGTSGNIGTITFRAKATGTGTVAVSSGKVLLNDGLGTNALSGSSGAKFTITPPAVGTPEVTSTTHPDSNGWSNKTTLELSWSRPAGVYGFSFELDQKEDTVPDTELDTTVTTTKKYESLKDGVWFFHIRGRAQASGASFGNTTHFRVGIDTVIPNKFVLSTTGDNTEPAIVFAAEDDLSGIGRYDLSIDDKLAKESVESPYVLNGLATGGHAIQIVAYDKAGNKQSSEMAVTIEAGKVPVAGWLDRNLEIPAYLLALPLIFILILLIWIIYLLTHRRKKKGSAGDQIAELQAEIDQSLDQLKAQISTKLIALAARSSKEMMENEEAVAQEVNVTVNKTRKKVDRKIGKISKAVNRKKDKILE